MPMAPDGSLSFVPRCRATIQFVLDGYATGPGSEDEPITVDVFPKTATVHGNGYQQADSWSLGFDYMDLPFDPNLIRAGAVEIYLFDAGSVLGDEPALSRQYGQAQGSAKGPDAIDKAALDTDSISERAYTGTGEPAIAGLFDDESLRLDDDGKWVTISGQDYTAELIRKQWPPTASGRARRIPVGSRLDMWAASILKEADPGQRLTVRIKDVDVATLPFVGSVEIANHRRGIPVQQNTSYWDVLYKVCTRYGFICYIKGWDFVVAKPKNLDDVSDRNTRTLAWGKNLKSLELTRHLGKEKVPRIVVHAFDDDSSKLRKIEEPETSPRRLEAKMSGKPSTRTTQKETIKSVTAKTAARKPATKTERLTDEFIVIPMYGISDESAIRRAARMLRALIGRGERKITATTRDLVDSDGKTLLNLEAGDAFNVAWQDFNKEVFANPGHTMEDRIKYTKNLGNRVTYLQNQGFQPEVAKAIAVGYQRLVENQRPLRLKEWTHEYSVNSGIDSTLVLVDFVVVDGVRDRDSITPHEKHARMQ